MSKKNKPHMKVSNPPKDNKLIINSHKITGSPEYIQKVLNEKANEWSKENDERHKNILAFGEFDYLPKDYKEALNYTRNKIQKKFAVINENRNENNSYINEFKYFMDTAPTNNQNEKFLYAINAVRNSIASNNLNNLQRTNHDLGININNTYQGLIDPYEAQLLFETTSLGYQGIVIPIKEGFSTTLSVASPLLDAQDLKNIKDKLVDKAIMEAIKTGIIDSYVFGGGVLTPVLKIDDETQYLGDLQELKKYFGVKKLSLDRIICFDRYCTLPAINNDGLFTLKLRSTMPIEIKTIFDNKILHPDWHAVFKPFTTSLSKLYRPDNFGISIFARAGKAVYNYEQQIQFLNYALSQLSIIVFNSKTRPFEEGGNADNAWDSPFGDNNINAISQTLASMQDQMNNQRGIYLNDIEVSTINRTFTGIGDIIRAMKEQASIAFDIKQDLLFGDVKSGLGNQTNEMATPMQLKYREQYRAPILKVLKWCVFGYFAEKDFTRITKEGIKKWDKDEFFEMLDNIELIYNDSVKTKEMVLKEAGVNEILRLVQGKLISVEDGIEYISHIPDIAKSIDNGSSRRDDWIKQVNELSMLNLDASIAEMKAQIAINTAIANKKDPLKGQGEFNNDPRLKPLEDFGELDKNGIIRPLQTDRKDVPSEATQRELASLKHEKK